MTPLQITLLLVGAVIAGIIACVKGEPYAGAGVVLVAGALLASRLA